MDWMLLAWKRYAQFSGRSSRKEYWMFVLGVAIVYTVLLIPTAAFRDSFLGGFFYFLSLIFNLAAFIPALACIFRRFQDQDKSGWLAVLAVVPIVNLVVLVFMLLPGTDGPNQYGPDPVGVI